MLDDKKKRLKLLPSPLHLLRNQQTHHPSPHPPDIANRDIDHSWYHPNSWMKKKETPQDPTGNENKCKHDRRLPPEKKAFPQSLDPSRGRAKAHHHSPIHHLPTSPDLAPLSPNPPGNTMDMETQDISTT
jgi:hypothetical protein